MTTNQLNVGIIGAGRIGKVHAENLAFRVPEARALAINDLNRDAAEKVASRCGIPTVAESADQILTDPAIRAILICHDRPVPAEMIAAAVAERIALLRTPLGQFQATCRLSAALSTAGGR